MAGKKKYSVVAVIGGLTRAQSAKLSASILEDKGKIAPCSRGTIAAGEQEKTCRLLQDGNREVLSLGEGDEK